MSTLRIRVPVASADPLLPLGDLEWQSFETFCEEYVAALPGTDRVHRYGMRGEAQKRIDFSTRSNRAASHPTSASAGARSR